jgi:hypothetical protein
LFLISRGRKERLEKNNGIKLKKKDMKKRYKGSKNVISL